MLLDAQFKSKSLGLICCSSIWYEGNRRGERLEKLIPTNARSMRSLVFTMGPGSRMLKVGAACLLFSVVVSNFASNAGAALTLLKPSPTDVATFSGKGGYSADGLGQNGVGGTVQAEVPSGSTVVQAYLYGSYHAA